MMEPWTTIITVANGGAGLLIIGWLLNRQKERSGVETQRATLAAEERTELQDQANLLREELRKDRNETKARLLSVESQLVEVSETVIIWKNNYFTLLADHSKLNQQYILVAATLDNIVNWLTAQGITIPMALPSLIKPPALPLKDTK